LRPTASTPPLELEAVNEAETKSTEVTRISRFSRCAVLSAREEIIGRCPQRLSKFKLARSLDEQKLPKIVITRGNVGKRTTEPS